MSRSSFGFVKILWNYGKYGMLEHGTKSIAYSDGEWFDKDARLKVGDVVGQSVWHKRGDKITESAETWKVVEISKKTLGPENRWYGRWYRVKWERVAKV